MGTFRVEVTAVGGHGCDRQVNPGTKFIGCGQMGCPDCMTAEYVQKMKNSGCSIDKATLTHWPGQESEIVDTFVFEQYPVSRAYRTRNRKF